MWSGRAIYNSNEYGIFRQIQKPRLTTLNLSGIWYYSWLQSRYKGTRVSSDGWKLSISHKLQAVHESLVKEGISIDDELRCSLLDQTSLNYDLFDEDEQSEFIFRLFKMIVLGQGARSLINRSNRPWTARAIHQKVDPSVNMKQTSIRT